MRQGHKHTLPNVILAGAQKSGTSSLFDCLAAHPHCLASNPKEPTFFSREANLADLSSYARCFDAQGATGDPSVIFEGSTSYMAEVYAPKRIRRALGPNVRFRDVGLVMPFVLQVGMYACPIIYSVSQIPQWLRFYYRLNPMVGVIEGFRWSLVGVGEPPLLATAIAAVFSVALVLSGAMFFRRTEATFADIL